MLRACVVVLLSVTAVFGQQEILRQRFTIHDRLRETSVWADKSGYLLIDFEFFEDMHTFKLVHRESGEITTFTDKMILKTVFGFASNDGEFDLFVKAFYRGKNNYYTITFFKSPRSLTLVRPWDTSKMNPRDYLLWYSHMDKLYMMKKDKQDFVLTEVSGINEYKHFTLDADLEDFSEKFGELDGGAKVDKHPGFSLGPNRGDKLYPENDRLIVVRDVFGEGLSETRIATFNLQTGASKIDVVKSGSLRRPNCSSLVMDDRLYRVEAGKDSLSVAVYGFPSLASIKRFSYHKNDSISIKSSLMRVRNGYRDEDKTKIKDMDTPVRLMSTGTPYLSGATVDGNSVLRIGSRVVETYGGGYGQVQQTAITLFEFDVCISSDFNPCKSTFPKTVHHQIDDKTEEIKNVSPLRGHGDANDAVYGVYVNLETKEYFIRKFVL